MFPGDSAAALTISSSNAEVVQARCGNDDGVAPSANVFGDPQEPASGIFFEGEQKGLALDLEFVGPHSVFVDRRLGVLFGRCPKGDGRSFEIIWLPGDGPG